MFITWYHEVGVLGELVTILSVLRSVHLGFGEEEDKVDVDRTFGNLVSMYNFKSLLF